MRVLLPLAPAADTFTENVAVTLRSMGHEVATPRVPRVGWHRTRIGRAISAALSGPLTDAPTRAERRLVRLARSFHPDLLLSLTAGLHPEVLDVIGRMCGRRRVLWWGDAPANSRRWGMLEPRWDAVYLKDPAAVAKLCLVGRNAHLLHEAMNPMWHRPIAAQTNEDIALVGNSYAFRQAICLRLMERGTPLAIYGPRPPRWSNPAFRSAHSGRYVVKEEKSRVFGEALACLNTFSLAEGDSLNCRAFEIAGAGGLQLIEDRPSIRECFEPGKELLAFSTFEELMAHTERARKDPAAMSAIREAGARRALAEHTYRHRLERILKAL